MEFRFIDYSSALFGESLPPVRSGKFIQIIDAEEDVESVVLSPYGLSKYHAQILERYAAVNELAGRYIKKHEFYQVTGGDIEVVGGGHWKIDGSTLRLSGESTAYGKFDPKGLVNRIRALPEFRSVVVTVE